MPFADLVLKWAAKNFSDFPWRSSRSPYEVLMAEVLLKRTTATAVARVYEQFLQKFPSLRDIVSTRDEELVECLSGLGLQHQRAHALKRLASELLSRHGGSIPIDLPSLLEVPGLGDYSATAILAFGYGAPVAILDVNVERILVRVYGQGLPPRPSKTLLYQIAQSLLPDKEHRAYNYGLLDLGRRVCTYVNPKCETCPLAPVCDFFAEMSTKKTHEMQEWKTAPNRLRALRHGRGLSLKRLAEIANVSKLTVIRIEAGKSSPRYHTIEKLAQALCVDPCEMVEADSRRGRSQPRIRKPA